MRFILGMPADEIEEKLVFAAQLGVDGVLAAPRLPASDPGYYAAEDLLALRNLIESHGLVYEALSTLPWQHCHRWMLGLPGRDEQIEGVLRTIRNAGRAGVPLIVFNMHAMRHYRTGRDELGRAGTSATVFDMRAVADLPPMVGGPGTDVGLIPKACRGTVSDETMWDNYAYFVRAAVPVAEEAGVKLALHPDDPPVPQTAGVARIMRSAAAFRRAMETVPSPNLGVKFCVGCFSEMGEDVAAAARAFAAQGKILLVDWRNVRGTAESFRETYLDNGQEDMLAIMRALVEAGYDGPISPDHAVHMAGDTAWGHRYWAYAIGHMRATLAAALACHE